jgi:hypothetical protein
MVIFIQYAIIICKSDIFDDGAWNYLPSAWGFVVMAGAHTSAGARSGPQFGR